MYTRRPRRLVWFQWIVVTGLAGGLGLLSGVALAVGIFILILPLMVIFPIPIALTPLIGLVHFGVPPLIGGMLGGSIGAAFQWLLRVRFHDSFLHAVRSYALAGSIAALPMLPFVAPLLNNDAGILLGQLTVIGAVCGVGRAFILRKTVRENALSRAETYSMV
jgi:hypothetical protein